MFEFFLLLFSIVIYNFAAFYIIKFTLNLKYLSTRSGYRFAMKKSASTSILISSERSTRGNQVEQFLIKSFEVIEQSRKCGCTSFFSSCSSSVAYPPSDVCSLAP